MSEPGCAQAPVSDVVITGNRVEGARVAIGMGGASPVERAYITNNVLSSYLLSLSVIGCRSQAGRPPFSFADSIIARNEFRPGRFVSSTQPQGTYASAIGAGTRVDLSENNAVRDGAGGASSWRAGHFWYLQARQENLLVSQNQGVCTGDLIGDGEFMAFDSPGEDPAFFGGIAEVQDDGLTNSDYVTILGTTTQPDYLGRSTWNMTTEDMGDDPGFFATDNGFWLNVVHGKGVGQVRRIVSYVHDAQQDTWRIDVSPPWDVRPDAESVITAQRLYRQLYVIDNYTDSREEAPSSCAKSNVTRPAAGAIQVQGPSADSAIAGNQQFDSEGIIFAASAGFRMVGKCTGGEGYLAEGRKCSSDNHCIDSNDVAGSCLIATCGEGTYDTCVLDGSNCDTCEFEQDPAWSQFTKFYFIGQGIKSQFFAAVHDNLVDTEYDFEETSTLAHCIGRDHGGRSGIRFSYAVPWLGVPGPNPPNYGELATYPVLGYGMSITRNDIIHADAVRGGAIAIAQTGSLLDNQGDPDDDPLVQENLLIQHNRIRDMKRLDDDCECLPPAQPLGGELDGGTAIHIGQNHTKHTVIADNSFERVCYTIENHDNDTTLILPSSATRACNNETNCSDPGEDCNYITDVVPYSSCFYPDGTELICPEGQIVKMKVCPCNSGCAAQQRQLECRE